MPTLNVTAPDGAEFVFEEVKSDRGTKSLGEQPMLVWRDLDKAFEFYTDSERSGKEVVADVLDGTSFRVSFQGIARRLAVAGKTPDEIAEALIKFRPGRRGGSSTPESEAKKAAGAAAAKLGADGAVKLSALLERIAKGELSEDEAALLNL